MWGQSPARSNNGTRSLQNAVGNGGPGHIPLDVAAEVARSVNAGTTGLMPKELAKRQLETARQLMAERAKAKLEESAAEHGNTPETERAVLDTPVEMPDGTIASLASLEEAGSQDARAPRPGNAPGESARPGNAPAESARPGNAPAESARPGNAPAESKPGGRPGGAPLQGAPASGLRPVGDGVYVHGAVPEARVETGAEIDMPDGTRVKGVLVKGLDPAEMLRPERRDAVADFLIEVIDGAQGRVAFETPEAEAAARELLKERVAREKTQAQRQAEQEIVDAGQNLVDGLFGKESGVKVRRGTPEEAMEAAEGAVGKNAAVELLKDTAGEVKGYWDRAKREVVLFGGASVETLGHEIAWHAVRQWAETHSPELLAKMNEYAKRCPEELRKLIEEAYKDFSGDALLDEIGAGRFESELGGRFRELLGRNAEARTWWEGVKATLKEMWQAFVKMIDGGGIDLRKLEKMDADEGMRWLVDQMLQGRRLEGGDAGVMGAEPGDKRLSLAGRRTDGIEVYESDPAVPKMPYRKRKKQFRDVMVKQYAGRTARFTRNGQTYYATFEKGDVRKNIHGDAKSDREGLGAKINAGASGDMFDLVENARYDHTSQETGKKIRSHSGVKSWDYFDKTVQIDNKVFDVVINVRDKGNDQFVYNVQLNRNRNIKPVRHMTPSPQSGTVLKSGATGSTPQSISQPGGGAQAQIRPSIAGRKGAERLGVGKAADAEAMEKAGASREEIWKATRLWKDKEGKWREGVLPSKLSEEGKEQRYYEVPFEKAVDKIVANKKPVSNEHVYVGTTSKPFEEIGLVKMPVMMGQGHVVSCYFGPGEGVQGDHLHGLKGKLKLLPKAIEKPMMIIASESSPSDSLVAIVKMTDAQGSSVIVPVEMNGIGQLGAGCRIEAHIAKTMFGKKNAWKNLVAEALKEEARGNVGVFYIDKNEARTILNRLAREAHGLGRAELQSLRRANSVNVLHSIHDPGSPVKWQSAKISSQTQTRQFKEWFADSKVVDENGEPLVVYRRDNEEFTVFDKAKTQQNDAGWLGKGFYFYGDKGEAERATGYGKNLRKFYLKAENPYYITQEEYNRLVEADDPRVSAEFAKRLTEEGYDSVYWNGDGRKEWMVLEPTQIKSATDNIGTFDPGNPDIRYARGGYKPGDWRKTFAFGKAARGAAEQTNGGIAAGEERRRWEENPVDERIPEWDAPARNPNVAKPFALSAAEGVRLVKLLGGTMKKPRAYKDAIGVIDESDEQRIREDLKAMGFFKSDDYLWAATSDLATVAADRADSQAALDARLEKLGEQRLKGEAGGGNRGLVRVSMSQVADLVLSLPAETGGNLGNVRTLAQGIVRGFERDRTPEQAAYFLQEAQGLLDWFYGREVNAGPQPGGRPEGAPLQARDARKVLARAFGAFLEAPDAVAERAPGLYREFVDAISRNDKLLHAFDAIRRTALGEGSAERVYAEIEAGRTARAEEAARRLADEVEKPIGSRLERAKDSFVYNFDDMHGPIFMHITRAQKRQLAELKASLKAGRITQAEYDAATAAFRQAVQGLKIAELKVDRGWQNEIRQYLWDMGFVFEEAKAAGVDPKDVQRYMDLRWIVSTGGRAGARGMSARDAQIVLDNMKRHMGDEAFARLEGVSAKFHAVREKNILDDPRLAAMIGQDRVNYFKNNVHYVRTERARATPEELAKMEADRAAFRRENKGDDDVTAAMLALIEKTGGRGGGIGNSTWGHALEGSVRDVKDRLASTWRNDTRLMAAMERNDFVIRMRDALLAAKAEGVHDLPGSRGVDYPQNARYGHIRYFDGGRQRVLVVPRVLADGYRQVSDAMTGWSAWGKIAHGVFIDWNLAYTLRNMTRNMASNESNIVGMRADNATIVGNALLPGAGRAASMAAYQLARHLPSAAIRNPFVRAVWGGHVNAAYAGQAQRILELYLDPRKAVERRAAADEARLRGETGPAMELESDLEMMRFVTKGGALVARWDEVHGAGRDADLFMQGRGLGPIYGDAGASAPKSRAHKILAGTGKVVSYPFRRNAQFNRDLELHAKITAALAIHEMQPGLTAEQVGIEVARRASIPHAERRGANSKMINYAWNMFFNTALKGGQRFVGNVVRNPRLAGKMVAQSLGPQLFWATMIAGGDGGLR